MDEDPRFPNRKKKRDWDDMSALDKPVEALRAAAGGEPAQEEELPQTVYRVVETQGKTKEDELKERQELYSFGESIPENAQAKVEAPVFVPVDETPASQQKPHRGLGERIKKFTESQTRVYATIGVALGVLLGVVVASVTWFMGGAPNGRYDLGPATSSATGLKGQLFVEWDKQLGYRLQIEPDDASRQAAFAMAVANSPHPLSVEIHLQDSEGFVLCSRDILLKYDARNAIALAPSVPNAQVGKPGAQTIPGTQPAQAIDPAQADAQEAAREKGKDLFKNQVGPDGQITGIGAQGEIPCTAKAYEKAVAWSFTPNFPTIAEQDRLMEHQPETAEEDNEGHQPGTTAAARKKAAVAKVPQKVVTFSIEGDDSIVEFDTSRGVIETTSGRAFSFDRSSGAISDPRWQDYPVEIHYRCDQSTACTVMHPGSGTLQVRLRR